jgi:hypothetical protein
MKKLLLTILIALSLNTFAQNKWIYVDSRVSGSNLTFELFKKQPDNSYTMIKTGTSTYTYKFDNLSAGIYRVHVTIDYSKYVPTWHPKKALWEEASDIDLTTIDTFNSIDGLLPNPAFFGPGSINGEMTEGLLKTQGDPLKNIRVLIVDNSNNLIKMVNTNDSGKFSVTGIPVGTYKIKTDVVNASNTNAKSVVLDSTHLNAIVKLTVNKTGATNTGIAQVGSPSSSVLVYPNPASNFVHVSVNATKFSYGIYNITGQLIKSATVNDNHVTIDMSQQISGVYFMSIEQNGKIESRRIVLTQ